jgi:hypothetical protein
VTALSPRRHVAPGLNARLCCSAAAHRLASTRARAGSLAADRHRGVEARDKSPLRFVTGCRQASGGGRLRPA